MTRLVDRQRELPGDAGQGKNVIGADMRDRVEVIRRSLLKSDTSEVPIEISNATSR